MSILLAEQVPQFSNEPLLASLEMIATAVMLFLATKGKLRDWFIR